MAKKRDIKKIMGLAFEGGGMAENASLGGYKRIIQAGPSSVQFKFFAGTSAGSILASLLGARASIEYIEKKYAATDFTQFMDSSWNPLANIERVVEKYGWYKGDALETWIAQCMKELCGDSEITFAKMLQQFGTVLIITKVDVLWPRCKLVVMDHETHPNKTIHSAVRESSSIPFAFQAIVDIDKHVYVDGGVLLNYPLKTLYKYLTRDQVIGLSLSSIGAEEEGRPVETYVELIESIATTWREQAMSRHLAIEDWKVTCKIPVSLNATDFRADRAQLDAAIQSGYNTMGSFLASSFEPLDSLDSPGKE